MKQENNIRERENELRVCIIDDEETVLKTVERILQTRGYKTLALSCTVGSSQQIKEFQPHIVVVDLKMPAIEGDELIRIFRKTLKKWPRVILFSGVSPEELKDVAMDSHTDDYIYKGDGYFHLLRSVNLQAMHLGLLL
ncbi:MAG: response regulator [bacterium]